MCEELEEVEEVPMSRNIYKSMTMMEVYFLRQDVSCVLRSVSTPPRRGARIRARKTQ